MPVRLKADNLIVLGYYFNSICRYGKLGILIGKVLICYPATAGTEPSYIDRNLRRKYLGHQLLERWYANAMHIVRHSAVH